MTEELTQEKEKIFSDEEIHEMFDTSFLPKLQEFAIRAKERLFKDKSPIHFHAQMTLNFADLENPLTYESIQNDESIKEKVNLQLRPIFQEDIDRAAEEAKKAEEEKKNEEARKGEPC